ncbi:hypothetical protein M9979_03660 [Sphingomonas sp. RP10(2022)]|uniref:Uncharacterized protein n=1 Tax=Sphingomonas liriopis TaxID=2949094 RepID=A0A9X2HTB2_9SPHN|nr:hypothetical protein [Sphingomonas liriopis]MCP3733971.1 hypothetical protein [Sphingomonas liriopis]
MPNLDIHVANSGRDWHNGKVGDKGQHEALTSADGAPDASPVLARDVDGEEQLDIHKPKPVHSWREFINEIGVIVIGVLIALGGEQAVESLHWRHVVGETKESLSATVEDAYGAMLSRQEMQSCVDRRLGDIATILSRHDQGEPLGIVGPIGAPTASVVQTYAFDMAIASQAFSHMPITDQAKFFEPIGVYRTFDEVIKDERSIWREFRALERASFLTQADWSDVRKAYNRASDLNAILSANLRNEEPGLWLYPFRPFHKPKSYSLSGIPRVRQLCRPAVSKSPA